jgi:hypothetical protein
MNGDIIEKISSIIPEVWFDLIGRVIPGVVIVISAAGVSGLSFGGWAVGLVVAYVVGFIFDNVSNMFFRMLFKKGWPGFFQDYWDTFEKLSAPTQQVMVKMFAEATMLRSFTFYLLLQFFLALWMLLVGHWQQFELVSDLIPLELRNGFRIHPLPLSLVFLVVTFACWIMKQQVVIARLKWVETHTKISKSQKTL